MLTKAFKHIDIDSMPSPYIERRIEENRRFRGSQRPHERFIRSNQWKTLGLAPEKLLDWRSLERRWFQLHHAWRSASEALWDIYVKLGKHSAEAGGGGEVWMPNPGGETCDVYGPESKHSRRCRLQTNVPAKELIDRAIPDPDLRPFVVQGDDLDLLHRYKRRIETMRRRSSPYWIAWHTAVESRLEAYAQRDENRLPFDGRTLCNPCAFVFSNDDRAYLITSDEYGHLKWHDEVNVHIDGLRPPTPGA